MLSLPQIIDCKILKIQTFYLNDQRVMLIDIIHQICPNNEAFYYQTK